MTRISFDNSYEVCLVEESVNANLFSDEMFVRHQAAIQNKKALAFGLFSIVDRKQLITQVFSKNVGSSEWSAPITGAFSSIDANEYVTLKELEFFVSSVTRYLCADEDVSGIRWRMPPLYYKSNVHTKLNNVLYRLGWNLKDYDLNFHLPITTYDDFRDNLSSSKRRELNRITKTDARFSEVLTTEGRKEVYNVIKLNRESQGYPMTMTWEAIFNLACVINEKIKFYILERNGEILAGAICLVLDSTTGYVFYWGENPHYRQDSPIVKLAEGIYLESMKLGFSVLDIGTSTNQSEPNQGLINFKENIGCMVSQKLTFFYDKKRVI